MNTITSVYTVKIAADADFIGSNKNRFCSAGKETQEAVALYTLIMAFAA